MKLYQCPDCKTIRAEPGPDSPTPDRAGDPGPQCCQGAMEPVARWGPGGPSAAWRRRPAAVVLLFVCAVQLMLGETTSAASNFICSDDAPVSPRPRLPGPRSLVH